MAMSLDRKSHLKVCMVSEHLPPVHGGAGKQAITLANALAERGVRSWFLTVKTGGRPMPEGPGAVQIDRVVTCKIKRRRLYYFLFSLKVMQRLFSRAHSYKIIHLHSIWPFCILLLTTAKLLKKKIIVKLTLVGHDDPISLRRNSFLWKVEALALRYYDRVVCISKVLYLRCLQHGIPANRIELIANGVDMAVFRPVSDEEKRFLRGQYGFRENDFLVCFIGRLSRRKGVDILLDAWLRVSDKRENVGLLLVGPFDDDSGRQSQYIRNKIATIQKQVNKKHFRTAGQQLQVAPFLQLSDCFVFPSRAEGLPTAVIEAMACGVPAITHLIQGITDTIVDNTHDGFVLDTLAPSAYAQHIIRLRDNPILLQQLGINAVNSARSKFSIFLIADSYVSLYNRLLRSERPC